FRVDALLEAASRRSGTELDGRRVVYGIRGLSEKRRAVRAEPRRDRESAHEKTSSSAVCRRSGGYQVRILGLLLERFCGAALADLRGSDDGDRWPRGEQELSGNRTELYCVEESRGEESRDPGRRRLWRPGGRSRN